MLWILLIWHTLIEECDMFVFLIAIFKALQFFAFTCWYNIFLKCRGENVFKVAAQIAILLSYSEYVSLGSRQNGTVETIWGWSVSKPAESETNENENYSGRQREGNCDEGAYVLVWRRLARRSWRGENTVEQLPFSSRLINYYNQTEADTCIRRIKRTVAAELKKHCFRKSWSDWTAAAEWRCK